MCLATTKPMKVVSIESPELMEPASTLVSPTDTSKYSRRRLLLKRSALDMKSTRSLSSCSETEAETESDDDNSDIQLITRPKSRTFSPPLVAFASELQEASANPIQTTLHLTDFVERSTRHDIYALRDLLLQDDREWTLVSLKDRCYATNFRRWAYKKENVNHHIQNLCLTRNIPLEYHAQLELNVDDMSIDSVLALIQEIKKHPEVRQLDIVGHLNTRQEESLLAAVTSLLRLDDRDWDSVNILTGFAAGAGDEEYEAWRNIIMNYMGIFSQLYTKYNIPIDIRPCAE